MVVLRLGGAGVSEVSEDETSWPPFAAPQEPLVAGFEPTMRLNA